jgi:hypothetical protein
MVREVMVPMTTKYPSDGSDETHEATAEMRDRRRLQ